MAPPSRSREPVHSAPPPLRPLPSLRVPVWPYRTCYYLPYVDITSFCQEIGRPGCPYQLAGRRRRALEEGPPGAQRASGAAAPGPRRPSCGPVLGICPAAADRGSGSARLPLGRAASVGLLRRRWCSLLCPAWTGGARLPFSVVLGLIACRLPAPGRRFLALSGDQAPPPTPHPGRENPNTPPPCRRLHAYQHCQTSEQSGVSTFHST